MLRPWFFGSSGQDERQASPAERLGLFVLLLAISFPFAWLAFYSVRSVYEHLLASGAGLFCFLVDKPFRFVVEPGRLLFRSTRPSFEAWLEPVGVYSNTAFLWALLLATPGIRLGRRFLYLGIGAFLLYLSHVFFVITKVEMTLLQAAHPWAGNEVFWHYLDDFFEVIGKVFFPILIWLGLHLVYLMGAVDPARRSQAAEVGRNQPCPCGSGRKYKHCCLRASR